MAGDGDDTVIEREPGVIGELLREAEAEAARTELLTPALRGWMTKVEARRAPRPGAAPRAAEEPRPPAPPPPGDPETAIPRRGDPYDKAYARPSARMLPSLCLVLADGTRRAFPYSGRVGGPDWLETPQGLLIVLRFADVRPTEVVLAGARLDELYELLVYQKVAWVRAVPPGKLIGDRAMPVVTGILIRPWKPEPEA